LNPKEIKEKQMTKETQLDQISDITESAEFLIRPNNKLKIRNLELPHQQESTQVEMKKFQPSALCTAKTDTNNFFTIQMSHSAQEAQA
jgi:hypothetical protein